MKKALLILFVFVFSNILLQAQTYIKNVTIVDVEKQLLVNSQTVQITGDKITAIAATNKIKLPPSAIVVDGTGKYLMPGMIDAHVHFFQSGGLYTRPDAIDLMKYLPYDEEIKWVHSNMEDFLKRYLRNGITSVIDVGSNFSFLKQRDSLTKNKQLPNIYMAGPLITTYEPEVFKNLKNEEPFVLVSNKDEAKAAVQKQLPYHPDIIKIWYITDPDDVSGSAKKYEPMIRVVIEEAHKNNLKVAVHATEMITAQLAVENNCDFLVHCIEDTVITTDFVKLLKAKNVVLCPTITINEGYEKTFGQEKEYSYYELVNANPFQIGSIEDLKHLSDTTFINRYKRYAFRNKSYFFTLDSIRKINLKKLSDGGVTIAAGTDAGNIGTMHASSYNKELVGMQVSGMSVWKVINSATIGAAKAIGKETEIGSIRFNKKADLVLLNADPTTNLENLKKVELVIKNGKIIKPDSLIKETKLALVQRQVNAYNLKNLDAFLEPYANDIEIYSFGGELTCKGKEEMRKQYAPLFKNCPNLHCEIKNRIVQGNKVIDKESITGAGEPFEGVAIYVIEENKIKKVFFVD